METKIFKNTNEDIEAAGKMLRDGGLVAFPTETVYGLGADALNETAVERVYSAKGRPADNPMIVHISHMNDLKILSPEVTEDMMKLAVAFWPGPLTIVMKKREEVPLITTGGLDTVAVRMPKEPVALRLIEKSGCVIAAPSANLSGKPSPTKAEHVVDDMMGRIDGILMGEECSVGIESTVVDMTGAYPTILRPGFITPKDIERVLKKPVKLDKGLEAKINLEPSKDASSCESSTDFKPKSPGMKYKHYAPEADMVIFQGSVANVAEAISKERHRLEEDGKKVVVIAYENPEEAARNFFSEIRAADKAGADIILVAALEDEDLGYSVMNRILKSSGYNIKKV